MHFKNKSKNKDNYVEFVFPSDPYIDWEKTREKMSKEKIVIDTLSEGGKIKGKELKAKIDVFVKTEAEESIYFILYTDFYKYKKDFFEGTPARIKVSTINVADQIMMTSEFPELGVLVNNEKDKDTQQFQVMNIIAGMLKDKKRKKELVDFITVFLNTKIEKIIYPEGYPEEDKGTVKELVSWLTSANTLDANDFKALMGLFDFLQKSNIKKN